MSKKLGRVAVSILSFSHPFGLQKRNLPEQVKVELVPDNQIETPRWVEQVTGHHAETYNLSDRAVLVFSDVHTSTEIERVFDAMRNFMPNAQGTIYGGELAVTLPGSIFNNEAAVGRR